MKSRRQSGWLVRGALWIGATAGGILALFAAPSITATIHDDLTCSKSAPCLEWDNASTGPGIAGTASAGGAGLRGSTSIIGSFNQNSDAVLGQDASTGTFNIGVAGISTTGDGVFGSGGFQGVVGSGATGFSAKSSAGGSAQLGAGTIGLNARGAPAIEADETAGAADGVVARGLGGNLLRVHNSAFNSDVFVVADNGTVTSRNNTTVNSNVVAIEANEYFTLNASGIEALGNTEGVEGSNFGGNGVAVLASGSGSDIYYGVDGCQGCSVTFSVDDSGNVDAHSFTTDLLKVRQPTAAGVAVATYPTESASPTLEDYGQAMLQGGRAVVALDPAFAAAIDPTSYDVELTADGDNGGIYVAQQTSTYFVVQENDGASTVAFDYRIDAKPYHAAGARLAPAPLRWERHRAKLTPHQTRIVPAVQSRAHPGRTALTRGRSS